MTSPDLFGDPAEGTDAEEQARRQEQRSAQFPLGLAPLTRAVLLSYALMGSLIILIQPLAGTYGLGGVLFPTGIIAAGIGGAISLRRSNQSNAIPRFLLITLVLTLICALTGTAVILYSSVTQPDLSRGYTYALFVIYLLISLLFANGIARRQRPLVQRWLELDGTPVRKNQGGLGVIMLWWVLMCVVSFALIFGFRQTAIPILSEILVPPRQYTAAGVTLIAPAGWVEASPKDVDVGCGSFLTTCVALVQQPTTGSLGIFVSFPGGDPTANVRLLAEQTSKRFPNTPTPEIKTLSAASLAGHPAATAILLADDTSEVISGITNGRNLMTVIIVCPHLSVQVCESIHDQFISTMKFSDQ